MRQAVERWSYNQRVSACEGVEFVCWNRFPDSPFPGSHDVSVVHKKSSIPASLFSEHSLVAPRIVISCVVILFQYCHYTLMSKWFLLIVCGLTVASFSCVWLFEPTIHYFLTVDVNTMSKEDYSIVDRWIGIQPHFLFASFPVFSTF